MVTAALFELIGAALSLTACSGAVAGFLVGRAKNRALEALAKSLPDIAPEPEPVVRGGGPFRTAAQPPPSASRAGARRLRRGGRLFHHEYDLMIGFR